MAVISKTSINQNRLLNISLRQIHAFLAAVQYKSFSQAATQICLSQPAFSRCIQDLESELGEALFLRSRKGAELSKFGEALLPHANRLINSYAETQTALTQWQANKRSNIKLLGSASIMHLLIPELAQEFSQDSDMTAVLRAASSAQVMDAVLSKQADFGLCTLTRVEAELSITNLLQAPLGLLIAESFRLPAEFKHLSQLDSLPMVRFENDSIVTQVLQANAVALPAYFDSKLVTCGVPGVFPLISQGKHAMIATGFGASHPQALGLKFVPPTRVVNDES
jgi:DNA-binding transcriptional LysR family regulator